MNFSFTQNSKFMCKIELKHMIYLQCSLPLLCDSEVEGVTPGCRVAGVEPGPPWNGKRPPREKEMEQEIGLVSFFPSLVSLSNPLHARTHTDTHTHA